MRNAVDGSRCFSSAWAISLGNALILRALVKASETIPVGRSAARPGETRRRLRVWGAVLVTVMFNHP